MTAEVLFHVNDRFNQNKHSPYFVHPYREYTDYFLCLWAILDDTDLLTKITDRDIFVINKLLERLQSLTFPKGSRSSSRRHAEGSPFCQTGGGQDIKTAFYGETPSKNP